MADAAETVSKFVAITCELHAPFLPSYFNSLNALRMHLASYYCLVLRSLRSSLLCVPVSLLRSLLQVRGNCLTHDISSLNEVNGPLRDRGWRTLQRVAVRSMPSVMVDSHANTSFRNRAAFLCCCAAVNDDEGPSEKLRSKRTRP